MLGAGTRAYPYIIQTPQDLHNVRNKITTGIYYELGNDIDMSSFGNFTPIGGSTSATRFKASFDGKGFSIKNIKIVGTTNFIGFISMMDTSTAIVKNVSFVNADVSSTANYTGVIVGGVASGGTITNCFVSGRVHGLNQVSSIAGINGGIVKDCYSIADVSATNYVYGIARLDSQSNARIMTSCFNGTLNDTVGNRFGVTGGVVFPEKVSNNYYNMDATGLTTIDDYGYGLTDAQMKDQSSFVGFNSEVWGFNGSYPYLKVFGVPPIPAQRVNVLVSSHIEHVTTYLESSRRKVNVSVSTVQPIYSNAQNRRYLIKNITSHIEEIVSNVSTLQNANVKEYKTISYVNHIGSNAIKSIRTIRTVESNIQPIQIVTDIEIPYRSSKPIYAFAYVVENPSSQIVLENKSSLSNYLNDTNLITTNNQTTTNEKENRTEMSVI